MRASRLLLALLLSGALLLPAALPVLADDDDRDDAEGDDGDGSGWDGDGDDEDRDHADGKGKGHDKDGKGDDRDEDRDDDSDEDRDDDRDEDRDDDRDDDGRPKDKDGKGKDRERDDARERAPAAPADLAPRASPAVVRVSQDYVQAAGVMTYSFTVQNAGGRAAEDVRLQGHVPALATWAVTDPTACLLQGTDVSCDVGDLAPGASRTVTVHGVLAGDVPSFTNIVQVYTPLAPPSSP